MNFLETTNPDFHLARHRQILKKYPSVTRLMVRNSRSFLYILLVVVTQFSVAALLQNQSFGWSVFIAFIFGAFLNHALYVFIHEATHNLIFRGSWRNRLVALFCDWPLILPSSMAFRRLHLLHHNHMGDFNLDADMPSLWERRWFGQSVLGKFIWFSCAGLFQALRPLRMASHLVLTSWVFANLALQALIVLSIVYVLGIHSLAYLCFSTLFGLGLHPLGGRWIAEHFLTNPNQETYSYYGVINRIMFNIGYHVEHHDFMNIPWNHLPKLKSLAPEYYSGLDFYDSYSKLAFQFVFYKKLTLASRMVRNVPAVDRSKPTFIKRKIKRQEPEHNPSL